ncbi:hypothetical protein [Streptomyces parvulus]
MPYDRTVTVQAPFDRVQQDVRRALADEATRRLDAALASLAGSED